MRQHKQVKVKYLGNEIEVDEGLGELLPLIWKLGCNTCNSCQENMPGITWIQFGQSGSLNIFLNAIAQYPENHPEPWNTLYGRMMKYNHSTKREKTDWKYDVHPVNFGTYDKVSEDGKYVEEIYSGRNLMEISISVRFPMTDIPLLIQILKDK